MFLTGDSYFRRETPGFQFESLQKLFEKGFLALSDSGQLCVLIPASEWKPPYLAGRAGSPERPFPDENYLRSRD